MGEIKSTLDLVMERTKGLVPTREEREELVRKENEDKVRALVRKLLIREFTPDRFREAVQDLERAQPDFAWREAACRECTRATLPGENEEIILAVLAGLGCSQADEIGRMVQDARKEQTSSRAAASERLLGELERAGITGSSVIPNVEADEVWRERHASILEAFARQRDGLASAPLR